VTFALLGSVLAIGIGKARHKYYIVDRTEMIGEDLASTTNSTLLVQLEPGLVDELARFSSLSNTVFEVRLGDKRGPGDEGVACSRVILSNAESGSLVIRLRQDSDAERFHVLSFGRSTEPASGGNR